MGCFFLNTNKEVIMKNEKDIGASAELNMPDDKPLVLKPEWESKPKNVDKVHMFSVTYDEGDNKLSLVVNGDTYRQLSVKDRLSGTVKFHEGVDKMLRLFRDWGFYEQHN